MTIDLTHTEDRWKWRKIKDALTDAGYLDAVARIEIKQPRDLAEVFTLLPDDVALKLWEVPDGQTPARLDG